MSTSPSTSAAMMPALIQGVPDRLAGWEGDFVVPKQYSGAVMAALTTGRVSTNIRSQIVQDVTTKILSYCKYPTTLQYEVVALKLTTQFPILTDTIGLGHVSNLYTVRTIMII